ncbi:MAG: effector-associated domain EAD1-containing protein, partial [Deltaproteobacteria bacterium]
MTRLLGRQVEALKKALLDAFPSQARLRQMLRCKLDKHLDAIALGDDLSEIAFKVIETSEAEGWTSLLVGAARESNPGNESLLLVAQQLGVAPAAPPRSELEALIKRAAVLEDV